MRPIASLASAASVSASTLPGSYEGIASRPIRVGGNQIVNTTGSVQEGQRVDMEGPYDRRVQGPEIKHDHSFKQVRLRS